VVIPSMPGYGFPGKPTATGWGRARIVGQEMTARALSTRRLLLILARYSRKECITGPTVVGPILVVQTAHPVFPKTDM
jgi:hypothetical protein